MAIINLRSDKERPLTIEEVDGNFDNLNKELAEKFDTSAFTASNVLTILDGNAGGGSTLDADKVHGKYPSAAAVQNTVAVRDALANLYADQFHGLHVGAVLGNVTGNVTGTVTGNASNVDGIVQVDHGGTGAVSPAAARTNLGIGTMGVQDNNTVNIVGGNISGITDLAIADGGTGASTASGARASLGLTIGSDIQAYNAILSGISAQDAVGDGFMVRTTAGGSVTRSLIAGNSISIDNLDGVDGDITIGMVLNPTVTSIIKSGTTLVGDIGQSANRFNVIYGKSTSAQYADLAERYTTDKDYEVGTVVVICDCEDHEAEASMIKNQRVLGVISEAPAMIMNDASEGQPVGLVGRVPVKVNGPIKKGQCIVADVNGCATGCSPSENVNVFGQALETNLEDGVKLVECFIK